mmetsp:Transcript_43644/g.72495  ORF Transcript_43644/g.72495 Transcript_43644/m.72495 type:complete len:188 (-) Transcript_43644:702-1265(-)
MASSNAQLTASSTSTFESLQQHQQQPRPLCRSLSNMQSTVSAPRAGGGLVMATKGRAAMTSKMTPKEVIRAGLHLEKEASIVKPELSRSQSANGREAATAANNPRRLNRRLKPRNFQVKKAKVLRKRLLKLSAVAFLLGVLGASFQLGLTVVLIAAACSSDRGLREVLYVFSEMLGEHATAACVNDE